MHAVANMLFLVSSSFSSFVRGYRVTTMMILREIEKIEREYLSCSPEPFFC